MKTNKRRALSFAEEKGIIQNEQLFKIGKESVIALIGAFSGVTLNYVFLMLITRILSPKEYGIYVLAQSIITSISVFVLLGAPGLLDRFIPFYQASGQLGKVKMLIHVVIKMTLILGFLFVILVYFFGPYLATTIFLIPDLTIVLRIMALSLPLVAFTQVVSFVFIGFKELRYQAVTEYFSLPILMIIFLVVLRLFHGNLTTWTWMYVVSCLGSALLSLWFLTNKIFNVLSPFSKTPISFLEMISFAWPLSLNTLLIILLNQIDVLVLGAYRDSQEVAIYRIYFFIALVPNFVHVSLGKICKPFVSGYVAIRNLDGVEEVFRRTSRWSLILNSFFIGIFVIFGRDLIVLLFTSGYDIYFPSLMILLGGRFLNSFCGYPSRILEAFGNVRLILFNITVLFLSNILLDVILVPRYGVYGAAFASSFCLVLWNIMSILEIKHLHNLTLFDHRHKYTFISLAVLFFVIFIFRQQFSFIGVLMRDFLAVTIFLSGYFIIVQKSADSGDREIITRIWQFLLQRRRRPC